MFGWFKRKAVEPLEFGGNDEAFRYACGLGTRFLVGALVPALVLEGGTVSAEGERAFLLRLADAEGGRTVWGVTLKESTRFPQVGDFVGFRIVRVASDLPEQMSIIGYIAVRLQPTHVPSRGWRIAETYTPSNIKTDLRL